MRTLLVLIKLRLLDTLRSKSSTAFVFLFPVVLLGVVGLVFSQGHPFERRTVLLVSEGAQSGTAKHSAELELALGQYEELNLEQVRSEAAASGRLRARMASAALVYGEAGPELWVGPHERVFGDGLSRAVAPAFGGPPRIVVQDVPRMGYVHYLFPGLLTFSVLLSGLFGMGYVMVSYRQSLFLKKLATTPLSKTTFVLAQILSRSLLVLVQNALLVLVAYVGFELPLSLTGLAWLLGITSVGLITFMGVGFVLACVIHTEELMVDIISSINIPVVFLSELFFPLSTLPPLLSWIGGALPSTQMVRLCREVLLYGETSSAALAPGFAVMLGWAVGTFGLSLLVFRWHK